jgi:hypothetical protein
MGDRIAKSGELANEKLQSVTALWRFMVLARPGLAVRAMADTGLRSVAMAGAANVFLSAVMALLTRRAGCWALRPRAWWSWTTPGSSGWSR